MEETAQNFVKRVFINTSQIFIALLKILLKSLVSSMHLMTAGLQLHIFSQIKSFDAFSLSTCTQTSPERHARFKLGQNKLIKRYIQVWWVMLFSVFTVISHRQKPWLVNLVEI
jgi:hypothetical protein